VFPADDGAAYEQIMGRWSQRLAPLLIEFGGLADGAASCPIAPTVPVRSRPRPGRVAELCRWKRRAALCAVD